MKGVARLRVFREGFCEVLGTSSVPQNLPTSEPLQKVELLAYFLKFIQKPKKLKS